MDNKFISRDTLRKRKARENETSSQCETRLAKQREITWQKRARENAEEREARDAYLNSQQKNPQQQNPQQKSQDSGADGAEDDSAEDGAEDGADTHTDAGVLGGMSTLP
ncbi:unnamed protein product [Rhizophagus irregularis]|nr:unnamed protein product [Rhizophagus irregularis]